MARRNCDVIRAMGMGPHVARRWSDLSRSHMTDQLAAADAVGGVGAASKVLRLLLQSAVLGLGAFLVIRGEVTAGVLIAASIIMSRALAPIDAAIAHWRGFVAARQSYRRLDDVLQALGEETRDQLELPPPARNLVVENLAVGPPGNKRPVVQNASFTLEASDGLGIIGPSASGKSTLARALVGLWVPHGDGGVRLDGARLDQWPPSELGRHVGYVPQDIELFRGTVADNIARCDPGASSADIVAAAQSAGAHEMIVRLPDGYQTGIDEGGRGLSAGQRQRVALARALFGNPFLVVLDEPNSNLDAAGVAALNQSILAIRRRGGIVVIVAHRPSILAGVNKVLALANGRVQAFGSRDEVLRKTTVPRPGVPLRGQAPRNDRDGHATFQREESTP
jgi:ATP-binding cassette subfamily C protein